MPSPPFFSPAAAAAQLPQDTAVVVLARDALGTTAAVSVIVVGVFFLLLVPLLLVVLLQVRKLSRTVKELGERGLRRTDPILERGKGIAENVEFVSAAIRTDVERLTGSVKALADRLHDASQRMEERIAEFNALMDVVQTEAEDIFVGTASTVRGVRAGARALGDGAEPPATPREETLRRPRPDAGEDRGEVYVSRPEGG
jgi:uncharacterized protein YoxC